MNGVGWTERGTVTLRRCRSSTALRSGRDDKGRTVAFQKVSDLDGRARNRYSAKTRFLDCASIQRCGSLCSKGFDRIDPCNSKGWQKGGKECDQKEQYRNDAKSERVVHSNAEKLAAK